MWGGPFPPRRGSTVNTGVQIPAPHSAGNLPSSPGDVLLLHPDTAWLSKARWHNPRLTEGQMEPHRRQQCLVLRPWGMLTFHFSFLLLSRFPNMSIVTCRMLEKKSALFLSCLLRHTRRTSVYFVGSRETSGLFREEIIPSGLGGVPDAVWRCPLERSPVLCPRSTEDRAG